MASKKEEVTEEPVMDESVKFDIEDIKDPFDELDNPQEEVVTPEAPAEVEKEPTPEEPAKEKVKKAKKVKKPLFKKGEKSKPEPKEEKPEVVAPPKVDPNEPLFVAKKRSIWGTIFTVLVTAIVTAALVLGGVYFYTKKTEPKQENPDSKIETTQAEEVTEEQKYVYVNSEVGLNLRKEPSTVAEILATLSNGTKLKVMDENDGWYQVEAEGKTGWVSKELVTEKNPSEYTNDKYGFSLTLPTSWSGYKVFSKSVEFGSFTATSYYFCLPTTDKTWKEDGIDTGYASMFAFTAFTNAQWETVQAEEGIKPTKMGESGNYTIGWSSAQAGPADLSARVGEISNVIKSFKQN